jgi:hypothetical protein
MGMRSMKAVVLFLAAGQAAELAAARTVIDEWGGHAQEEFNPRRIHS